MAGVNKAILIGHLGKDPKVASLNSGDKVVSFSLATSESWKDKQTGERREKTEWHNVVIYNENIGNVVEKFCRKGSKIYVEGQIQTRKFKDKDGEDRYITEIVLQRFRGEMTLLDSKGENDGGGDSGGSSRSSGSSSSSSKPKPQSTYDDPNDDIPF